MATGEYPARFEATFQPARGETIEATDGHLSLITGTAGTWVLRLVANTEIPVGTAIDLRRFNIQLAHRLQTEHPGRRDYTSVECSGKADPAVERLGGKQITITIEHAPLRPGDEITVRIGDRREGGPGSEVFWTATRGRLSVWLISGETQARAAEDITIETVCHPEPNMLRLLGPTVIRPGDPFDLHLVVFDRNRNPVESFTGTVIFDIPAAISGLPDRYSFTEEDEGLKIFRDLKAEEEHVYRIGVSLESGCCHRRSNPIVCKQDASQRVYWGDLHAHGWGDCTMLLMHDRVPKVEPLHRHEQGRDIGRFDYGAPGAMSMPPDDTQRREIWDAYVDAWEQTDNPGKYVPFLQMEMHPGVVGDRTLIFREKADIPIDMREPVERVYEEYADREDAMLEVHIGGRPPYYDDFRPANEELVEVSSGFGNAEWLMQKALQRGYRFAITGASDLHLGLMGAPRAVETFRGRFGRNTEMNVRDSGFGGGPVGAIVAPECTRDALWEALRNRRGYATSGDRFYLDLDAGGYGMGEVADLPEVFEISLQCESRTRIERIDMIVGEHLADSWHPDATGAQIQDHFDRSHMPPGRWFYFRVKAVNNEWAWTCPVWFADERMMGDAEKDWPPWNHATAPQAVETPETEQFLDDLVAYLEREDDRRHFGQITPIGVAEESMGRCAKFISTAESSGYPLTIRWFFEFEIPKIRIDWGYEAFGPVDCWYGPGGKGAEC